MLAAFLVVFGHVVGVLVLSWIYFRRYTITRPPIGVFTLVDIAIMLGLIVVIPYLYLVLPRWLVIALLLLAAFNILYLTWEPILRTRWAIWLSTIVLVGADLLLALGSGTHSRAFLVVNNIVLMLMVVGITNLWAQSGMQARAATVLAGALILYDYLATSVFGQMGEMLMRLAALPLMPMFAWPFGNGEWLGIGLGDVLLLAVFPLVMRKAFSRGAGLIALIIGILALVISTLVLFVGGFVDIFPFMVVLGPLILLQYTYWRYRQGPERTTWQYLEAEPGYRRVAS